MVNVALRQGGELTRLWLIPTRPTPRNYFPPEIVPIEALFAKKRGAKKSVNYVFGPAR